MTGAQSLELRGVAGIAAAIASAAAWALAPRVRMDRARFRRMAILAFAVSRLAVFAATFFLLHMQPRGDIQLYMEEGGYGYAGKLVYRDFITPHAPLSPYLLAAMLRLHYDARTIILFSILFDVAAFALWLRFSARLPDALTERRAALLMILSPISLLTVAIDGQMNSLIALGLAWSAVAAFMGRDALSGFVAAIAGTFVKFLSWIFVPVLCFASRRRLAWCLGFFALTAVVYAAFSVAVGDHILVPLFAEGGHKTTSNISFLLELMTGMDLGDRLPDLVLGTAWLTVIVVTYRAMRRAEGDEDTRRRVVLIGLIAVMMVVQVFSKNTWDRYLVMAMYPLCWLAAEFTGAQMALYCVWLAVCVTYRSAWSSLTGEAPSMVLHHALVQGNALARGLVAGEVLQTGGNIAILVFAVRRLGLLSSERIAHGIKRDPVAADIVPRSRDEAA